jgi:hypothetical protein
MSDVDYRPIEPPSAPAPESAPAAPSSSPEWFDESGIASEYNGEPRYARPPVLPA